MGEQQTWFGCVVPAELSYDLDRNVWLRFEGDEVTLGMTDVAQTSCGRFVQITWKKPGTKVRQGRPLAIIESAKWVGPFPAPLSGEIVATNEAGFDADIAVANRDPYGDGWLIRLRPSDLEAERSHLVDGARAFEHYREFIDENGVRCFRCEE
ncbi:MAG TPA: glycine cleavage system protein H [Acidimicrobiia bacterium]|nr:glycine cleavage system protein H [Acidimicrobiia bacterium]